MFAPSVAKPKKRTPSEIPPSSLARAPERPRSLAMAGLALPHMIQSKLAIGATDDPLEHEADRGADQVMCSPEPGSTVSPALEQVHRKCEGCEDEEESGEIQTKPAGPFASAGGDAPDDVKGALLSPGEPFGASDRAFFEPRFRRDLSQVRVHTDNEAAQTNRQLSAQAFTYGPTFFMLPATPPVMIA